MAGYPDLYYALSAAALWQAFQDGWTSAAEALVDRFGGVPPIPLPDGVPLAVDWADLLTRPSNPFLLSPDDPPGERPPRYIGGTLMSVSVPLSSEEQ